MQTKTDATVTTSSDPPNYGIDAPTVVRRFAFIGNAGVILGVVLPRLPVIGHNGFVTAASNPLVSIGITFLLLTGLMLWGSRIGKLRLRDRVVGRMKWRGDEMVLDVGCGHGLLLIAAAKRLTSGKSIGIDVWRREDQAGNNPVETLRNVTVEGVADRVELLESDARALPFPERSFDAVTSSWAIHNIEDEQGRIKALREIIRVLKPGGELLIVDIMYCRAYSRVLLEAGFESVEVSGPNFMFFIPTRTLRAHKPDQ